LSPRSSFGASSFAILHGHRSRHQGRFPLVFQGFSAGEFNNGKCLHRTLFRSFTIREEISPNVHRARPSGEIELQPSNRLTIFDKGMSGFHGGWKHIRYLQPGLPEELYDLGSDPEQLKTLASEPRQAERLEKLRQALAAELKRSRDSEAMLPPGR
jgi:hypothetical protein